MSILGFFWVNEHMARGMGYTHHAMYYFLPIWVNMDDPECPAVEMKLRHIWWLMDAVSYIEGACQFLMGWEEPGFMMKVGEEIKKEKTP